MNFNFALLLTSLVTVSGLIALYDIVFLAPKRKAAAAKLQSQGQGGEKELGYVLKLPVISEYARSFFPILLIVLLLRSFIAEPFRIPSGSLEPTLLVGDFILVNKYNYGLRLPVLNNKFLKVGEPKMGDIVVFRWPPDTSIDYIKRFVAGPGDHIQYKDKVLYINGKQQPQKHVTFTTDSDGQGNVWKVEEREEILNGVKHNIFVRPDRRGSNYDYVVPKGEYFAMGDNRDDSSDSRYWGFVPEANIIGRAMAIWMSWNNTTNSVRWKRLGDKVN